MQQNARFLFSKIIDKTTEYSHINAVMTKNRQGGEGEPKSSFRAQNLTNYWIPEQNNVSVNSISIRLPFHVGRRAKATKNQRPTRNLPTLPNFLVPSLFFSYSISLYPSPTLTECVQIRVEKNSWQNNFTYYSSNRIV